MTEREEDWTEAERRSLDRLPRELDPGPAVEDRIVEALGRRGLLPGRPRRRGFRFAAAAAGLLLVLAGYAAGRLSVRPAAPPSAPRFALLLLRGEERGSPGSAEETGRVAEYRAWARGLARGGRFVEGEKLEDRGARLVSASVAPAELAPSPEELRGFFIISAASFEEALAVARGCPHLRHGGVVLVRPIAG